MRILYASNYILPDQKRVNLLRRSNYVSVLSFRSPLSLAFQKDSLLKAGEKTSENQPERFYPFDARVPLFSRAALATLVFKRMAIIEKPDVIHASWIPSYPFMAYLARLKPLVALVIGSEIILDHALSPFARSAMKKALKYADAIVVDAHYVKRKVLCYTDDERKVFQIPVGLDTSVFRRRQNARDHIRNILEIEDDDILVICNRWHTHIHGVENLIHSIPKVISKNKKVKFLFIGSGPLSGYFKELVHKLKISSNVSFTTTVPNEDMPRYLSASDVYVSSSMSDGTSVSLLEAMSCELPVVVTNLPSIREWVLARENGVVIEGFDPSMIADGILRTIDLRPEWSKIGQRNRELVKKRADINVSIQKLTEVYEYAIEKS